MSYGSVPEERSGGRRASVRLVVDTLRRTGPSSQAGIARMTGLSRATVNNVVQKLRDEGLVDCGQANGRESVISLRSRRGVYVAVEANAHMARGALFDFAGERRTDLMRNAEGTAGASTSPPMIEELVRQLAEAAGHAPATISGVAVGLAAPIVRSTNTIASWAWPRLPNWKDVPLEATLKDRLGVPTLVDNDANLAALAEWTWGVGKGCDDFLYLTCGEAVGGGLIVDGRIYHGGTGLAGEIGHMRVEESGGVCFCGSRGCLSGFASERAILLALGQAAPPGASLADVIAGARKGDGACQRVLFDTGGHLGKALAAAGRVMAPDVIAVGGLLGTAGSLVLDGLQASAEIVQLRAIAPSLTVWQARIERDEVLLGAIAAALARAGEGASELQPWMQAEAAMGSMAA